MQHYFGGVGVGCEIYDWPIPPIPPIPPLPSPRMKRFEED